MNLFSKLECGRFEFDLTRPLVMGIVNVTPDSFSDGGNHADPDVAIEYAKALLAQGADILDIGGESTRPGAAPVTLEEELKRVLPVVKALRDCGKPISVDTRKPEVMRFVLKLGVDMINDVSGFQTQAAVDAIRGSKAAACIMHMLDDPQTMQRAPVYRNVVAEVSDFLFRQAALLRSANVSASRIVIDPGIGFGKTTAHNLALLSAIPQLGAMEYPVLIGLSRKSMVGDVTGRVKDQRLAGSLGGAVAAASLGAKIVRVHDVKDTVDALNVWSAMTMGRLPENLVKANVKEKEGHGT